MSFTALTKPAIGEATKKTLADGIIDDLADLNTRVNNSFGDKTVIINGSFEFDTDSDGIPDGWARSTFSGGTVVLCGNALTDTNCIHGARATKFTSTGSGGGTLTSSAFFECSPQRPLAFTWQFFSTVATVANKVQVSWYTAAQSLIQTDTIWTSNTGNPSTWTQVFSVGTPPSTARYAKLVLTGCDSSSATTGSTYFDNVYVTPMDFTRRTEFEGSGTAATTYNWTCPTGVSIVRVTCIGGGGGGGGVGTSQNFGGGGGGGGGLTQSVLQVTAGTSYAISVGGGGTGGLGATPAAGANGGDTTFASTSVVGKGGTGGATGGTGTGGAGGVAGTGHYSIAGISGRNGVSVSIGGDGGDSVAGKCGGIGGASTNGNSPATYSRGAGGGGAFRSAGANGAAGGAGTMFLEY